MFLVAVTAFVMSQACGDRRNRDTAGFPTLSTIRQQALLPNRGFTRISGAAFLSSDSILLADRVEGIGVVVLSEGLFVQKGDRGEGPGEYAFAAAVVPWGGMPAVHDRHQGRLLRLSPSGLTSITLPASVGRLAIAGATNSKLLFFRPPPPPAGLRDSTALISIQMRSENIDTLELIAAPRIQAITSGDGSRTTYLKAHPLGARDAVAMGLGGSYFVAYVGSRRICRKSLNNNGSVCSRLPTFDREVSSSDLEWAIGVLPEPFIDQVADLEWPKTTPPFGVLLSSRRGRLLLESSPVPTDGARTVLILDRNLEVTHAFRLGASDHLLALDFPHVLVYREDVLGLQWLWMLTIT